MGETVEVKVAKELAGEVAQGQAAPPFGCGEQIVARKQNVDGFLRIAAVDNHVQQCQSARAGEAATQVLFENGVVDGGEVAINIAAQHITITVAVVATARCCP